MRHTIHFTLLYTTRMTDDDDDHLGGIDYPSSEDESDNDDYSVGSYDESGGCTVCGEEHCAIHIQMDDRDYPEEEKEVDEHMLVGGGGMSLMDLLIPHLRAHSADLVAIHSLENGQDVIRQINREFMLGPTEHVPRQNPIQRCEIVFDFNASGTHDNSCGCTSCKFDKLEDKTCNICFEDMKPNRKMVCKLPDSDPHFFHIDCLSSWFNKVQEDGSRPDRCPLCRASAVQIEGYHPLPKESVFTYSVEQGALPGYSEDTHINIFLYSPSSVNQEGPYNGILTNAFMPNNNEGKELTDMLQKAWNQDLLFRVTRGQLVLNGIELKFHKTTVDGGLHSYPDPMYTMYLRNKLNSLGIR